MQSEHLNNQINELIPSSNYRCPKCKVGRMIPSASEGEPEYTESFTCNNCQHQDSIASRVIISGQFLTGILGIIVCCFLMITSLEQVIIALQSTAKSNILKPCSLVALSFTFMAGFLYVIFQAYKAYSRRQMYLGFSE